MAPAPRHGILGLNLAVMAAQHGPTDPAELERLIAPVLLYPLAKLDYERLARYTDILYRWNARMNLTAVRDWRVFARLHLAESLLAGQLPPPGVRSALDFGSGAGLPGIPMAMVQPQLPIMLAEAQGKKAAFLREIARDLSLKNVSVFHGRVEDLSRDAVFDLVTLRAVDKMSDALRTAQTRLVAGGWCLILTSAANRIEIAELLPGMTWLEQVLVPGTAQRVILRGQTASGF
jgi:16S rRNA (guanine527-N7)-methyltransferase